ncbi:hypothetical protein EVAR_24024_1 [Eumeta japonica]|uniref:Uncharacterized protein n=1 Tax=Eumeta variegata TaxID=151549 RepID=A0A4C1W9Q4_EUMVA|nr:hypothetical protein EVAR_24024_1 [Eumeta japonica]
MTRPGGAPPVYGSEHRPKGAHLNIQNKPCQAGALSADIYYSGCLLPEAEARRRAARAVRPQGSESGRARRASGRTWRAPAALFAALAARPRWLVNDDVLSRRTISLLNTSFSLLIRRLCRAREAALAPSRSRAPRARVHPVKSANAINKPFDHSPIRLRAAFIFRRCLQVTRIIGSLITPSGPPRAPPPLAHLTPSHSPRSHAADFHVGKGGKGDIGYALPESTDCPCSRTGDTTFIRHLAGAQTIVHDDESWETARMSLNRRRQRDES